MGVKYDKPLLRMFGKALMELECREPPCSQWTEWSECDEFVAQYGMKSRRRECGMHSSCDSGLNPRNETEFTACQAVPTVPTISTVPTVPTVSVVPTAPSINCPSSYDMTADGFCLKLYKTAMNKEPAEQTCRTDGGYLININSALKWDALDTLLKQHNHTSYVYIDGERKDSSSPWTFSYETDAKPYTNWASGEPDSDSTQKCLLGKSGNGIHDGYCSALLSFVCEIIPPK